MADTIRYGTTTDQEGKDRYFNKLADLPTAAEFGPGLAQVGLDLYVSDGTRWTAVTRPTTAPLAILFGDSIVAGGNSVVTAGVSATKTSDTSATFTCNSHALAVGNPFWFAGSDNPNGWGEFIVDSVIDANTFTATVPVNFPASVPTAGTQKSIINLTRLNDRNYVACAIAELGRVSQTVVNYGASGTRADQILPVFIRELSNKNPMIGYFGAGTNDVLQDRAEDDIKSDISTAIAIGARQCKKFLIATLPPIGPSAAQYSAARALEVLRINQFIRQQADKYFNVSVIDLFGDWSQSTTNDYISGFNGFNDGVHPNGAAAQKTATQVKSLLSDIITPSSYRVSLLSDRFASDGGNKQMLANPIMNGTGGTVLNAFVGQVVADTYTLTSSGTFATAAGTKETRSGGRGFNQVIAVTGSSSGAAVDLLTSSIHANAVTGDVFRMFVDLDISSVVNVSSINVYLEITVAGNVYLVPTQMYASGGTYVLSNSFRRYLSSLPFKIPPGAITLVRPRVQFNFAAGGGITAKVGCFSLERE